MIAKGSNDYNPSLPPQDLAVINVSVTVLAILEINENLNLFRSKQLIDLSWRDSRLTFYNLRSKKYKNPINVLENIWTPELVLEDVNLYHRDINEPNSVMAEMTESQDFTSKSLEVVYNEQVFEGRKTSLHSNSVTR